MLADRIGRKSPRSRSGPARETAHLTLDEIDGRAPASAGARFGEAARAPVGVS
jgi:hypothetical protein